ncbi:hypothetical protein GF402_09280 [Candidatus Fermentibacteria bacterium]|nr:hypothetical protein [Candidatus Fermentibacteria bacterium]
MSSKRRLLLHVCCAPCLTVVLEGYRDLGYEVEGLFYNPNIHPWRERERRLESLEGYSARMDMPLSVDDDYPLEENLRMLLEADNRCLACFRDRLGRTAALASEKGIDLFSTTLSVSPYQSPELLIRAGREAARDHGVSFVYRDYRPLYARSARTSRENELYRQPYCGCVLSERDRYLKLGSPGRSGQPPPEEGGAGPEVLYSE